MRRTNDELLNNLGNHLQSTDGQKGLKIILGKQSLGIKRCYNQPMQTVAKKISSRKATQCKQANAQPILNLDILQGGR